jgi:hypothetical protein
MAWFDINCDGIAWDCGIGRKFRNAVIGAQGSRNAPLQLKDPGLPEAFNGNNRGN